MNKQIPKLELEKVLLQDAAEIIAARQKSKIIHHTSDIDAAGDEVEQAVRRVLRSKLPEAYYVGHGHIVDLQLRTSSQLDVIVADNKGAPILFKAENGTEYFPYESVYAIGEVKSTYYRAQNHVHAFVKRLANIKSNLHRKIVLNLPPGGAPFIVNPDSGLADGLNYKFRRNPLFSFMLFVDSNDFEVGSIHDLYRTTPAAELPNIVCLLDKGVIINMRCSSYERDSDIYGVNVLPEFNKEEDRIKNRWGMARFGTGHSSVGLNFGYLYYALTSHLKYCVLTNPNLTEYLSQFYGFGEADLF